VTLALFLFSLGLVATQPAREVRATSSGAEIGLLQPVTATQSSSYNNKYLAVKCIDGNTMGPDDGSEEVGHMCHTKDERAPWIAIDYGKTVAVQRVEIFNRVNCCGDRTKNVDVRISDELPSSGNQMFSGGTLFGHFPGPAAEGEHIVISGQREVSGRYVIVQINNGENADALNLKEVRAFGRGISNNDVCQYNCLDKGVCEVLYIGPRRGGNTKGSCFPARFGGGCSGTPPECQECNRVIDCENSQEPEQEKCPLNGRFPNTDVFCLNEDGSTNCQQDSDCPLESNTCEDDPQGKVCYSFQVEKPDKAVKPYVCFSNDLAYAEWEECEEECEEGFCIPLSTAILAVNTKTTSSTTGQSFSGLGGVGQIKSRCPATRPCPYKSGKCGNLVGLGPGGRIPACPRKMF